MIEKSKRKKKINDEHSRNYDAGAVDVDERQLRRTGVRGRKIYVLIFILMLLLMLFVANLVVSRMHSVFLFDGNSITSCSEGDCGMKIITE